MNEPTPRLSGLVLAGGKSQRMHSDKAAIVYHEKSQVEHTFDILKNCCEKVFISSRENQREELQALNLPQIHDQDPFLDIGPMGGILSAMHLYDNVAWLVVACDLPFLSIDTINDLISSRNTDRVATAYKSAQNELPEPLCTIYEPSAKEKMLIFMNKHGNCPRKFLIESNANLIELNNKKALDNINNPDELNQAIEELKKIKNNDKSNNN